MAFTNSYAQKIAQVLGVHTFTNSYAHKIAQVLGVHTFTNSYAQKIAQILGVHTFITIISAHIYYSLTTCYTTQFPHPNFPNVQSKYPNNPRWSTTYIQR
jgi:hypothetical protein